MHRIYGVLATGRTPIEAAEAFRKQGSTAFGLSLDELVPAKPDTAHASKALPHATRLAGSSGSAAATAENGQGLMYSPETGRYKFRLFRYQQQRDGIPVYGAEMRTLVRVADQASHVVWAGTRLKPLGEFQVKRESAELVADKTEALAAAQQDAAKRAVPRPAALIDFSTPKQVLYAGAGETAETPRLAVTYTAGADDGSEKWTFVADAETGAVLHVEPDFHDAVSGTVKAEVMQGLDSMECDTLGVSPMPYARVAADGVDYFADQNGAFTIPTSGTVSVSSDISGKHFQTYNGHGDLPPMTLTVPDNGEAHFLHENNGATLEDTQAAYLAYKAANQIRDFLLSYLPDYPLISGDHVLTLFVNHPITDMTRCGMSGGGLYDGQNRAIILCEKSDTVTNSAFGSIVHHEYGHHINSAGGAGRGPYDEGMADTVAMLFSKNPVLGVGYSGQCSDFRRTAEIDCVYQETGCSSCGSDNHDCGQLLSSTIWDIWQNLEDNPAEDAFLRSMVLSSIPMHIGGEIDSSIAIDLLTLDDDDGVLENGTPHRDEICDAFAEHGMSCPDVETGMVVKGAALYSEGPSDGPFTPSVASYTIHNLSDTDWPAYYVNVTSGVNWLTVDAPSGSIAPGAAATVNVSVHQAQAAALADGKHSATIQFVNSWTGVTMESFDVTLRVGAPVPVYMATFDYDEEGFTHGDEPANAWHQSTDCADLLPGHSGPGSLYSGIDDLCNYHVSYPGLQVINSPVIDIENPQVVEIGFSYYLRTFLYDSPETGLIQHPAHVKLAVNGGPFELIASNTDSGVPLVQTPGWVSERIDVSPLLPDTGPVSIQIQFGMDPAGQYDHDAMGFVVDDVVVYAKDESQQTRVDIPARIEAEDYVRAYDTTAGNTGGGCDTGDDVDKEFTADPAGGGCNVGWIAAGEWLEYDVSVAATDSFNITARVASAFGGRSFHIEVDGVDVTGALSVPANGWQSYSNVKAEDIVIGAGDHVVRVYMNTTYININYLRFELSSSPIYCGNNVCDMANEDCQSCPEDCGECPVYCPDNICQHWEGCNTCPEDCGECPDHFCGDGTCDPSEDCNNCPSDCACGCTCPSGCDAVEGASVPFTKDGVDDACYFLSGSAGSYINNWNNVEVNLNDMDITNVWIGSQSYPALVDGGYYLYYSGSYPWSHVEVR